MLMKARATPSGHPPPQAALEALHAAISKGRLPPPGIPDPWPALCRSVAMVPRQERRAVLARTATELGIDWDAIFPPPPPAAAKVRRLSEIEEQRVEWLWDGFIPFGALTMVSGPPKVGKSFVAAALAAAVTTGRRMPLDDRPPGEAGSVLMLAAEDDPARTLKPRLRAHGADTARVHVLDAVLDEHGEEQWPRLRRDSERIAAAAAAIGDVRLIVLDTVNSYLGGSDTSSDVEVRAALLPLVRLAERLSGVVLALTHNRKGATTNGKDKVMGSVAYTAVARANFMVLPDPHHHGRQLWLANGTNLGANPPTLAFEIAPNQDGDAVVQWSTDPVEATVEEALAAQDANAASQAAATRTAIKKAMTWLTSELQRGPRPASELLKLGAEQGFTKTTLHHARQRAGVTSKRQGFGAGSQCVWSLDDTTNP